MIRMIPSVIAGNLHGLAFGEESSGPTSVSSNLGSKGLAKDSLKFFQHISFHVIKRDWIFASSLKDLELFLREIQHGTIRGDCGNRYVPKQLG